MRRASVVALCSVVLASAGAGAMPPTDLPSFSVTALDGQPATSTQLAQEGRWLLVYVRPAARLSTVVLGVLKKGESPPVDRMVVVVGGPVEAARKVAEGCPNLAEARWYADPDGEAFARLGLGGAPAVIGARAGRLEWKLDGTLAERQLKSILATWLEPAAVPPTPQP